MQLNPTLASHHTAHVRPAAPLNPSKKRVLRKRTPELHDSKGMTDKLAPQNTRKNAYNTAKNTTKSQLFGPTNPSRWKQKIRICLIRVSSRLGANQNADRSKLSAAVQENTLQSPQAVDSKQSSRDGQTPKARPSPTASHNFL
jgi:hypothetical protein